MRYQEVEYPCDTCRKEQLNMYCIVATRPSPHREQVYHTLCNARLRIAISFYNTFSHYTSNSEHLQNSVLFTNQLSMQAYIIVIVYT